MFLSVWSRFLFWRGESIRSNCLRSVPRQRALSGGGQHLKTLHDFMKDSWPPLKASDTSPAPVPPYLLGESLTTTPKKYFIETYGCQMNYSDTEVVMSIMESSCKFTRAAVADDADVILLMTCAIRENAESKIWSKLESLRSLEARLKRSITIGVLGCMAERLKERLMEKSRVVDIVCGPDAYRDLPRLLMDTDEGSKKINVMLSADETYADIAPVRLDPTKKSAFVSIMRGCNNMCAFCIVPFTR